MGRSGRRGRPPVDWGGCVGKRGSILTQRGSGSRNRRGIWVSISARRWVVTPSAVGPLSIASQFHSKLTV
jgi:hypothetical protein